jgi:CheY-like chemotaxis protein
MLLKKIVVAEDDDAIAHMVSMALGDAGYLCIRARDGEEALRITRMHQPDLLVLDVMMPRMDGRQVASKLKEDVILSKIPILMLTALSDVDSKIQGLDAGADDYMGKPFDLREFSARIRALIRSSRRERDRNPTTDLPGSDAIDDQMHKILSEESDATVMHFDVEGFVAYADAVGYASAESFVKEVGARILAEQRAVAPGFLGHLGGTDFIASCAADKGEELAKAMVAAFDDKVESWRGTNEDGGGEVELRLVVGVVRAGEVADEAELAKCLAAALSESREREGSNYVVYAQES